MSPHPRNCSKAIWATETRLNPFGVLPEESLTSSKTYVLVSDQYLPWEKVHFSYLIWSTGLFLLYQHLTSHTSAGKMWQNDKNCQIFKASCRLWATLSKGRRSATTKIFSIITALFGLRTCPCKLAGWTGINQPSRMSGWRNTYKPSEYLSEEVTVRNNGQQIKLLDFELWQLWLMWIGWGFKLSD